MPGPDKWTPPTAEQRCTATSKQAGRQCIRYKTSGHNVCYFHGAESPQAKNKVDRLFALAADQALEVLVDEMEQATTARDRIRAAIGILDRAGYGALRRVEITTGALEQELEKLNQEIAVMESEDA